MGIATAFSIKSLSMQFFLDEVQHHQISSLDTYLMYGTKHPQMKIDTTVLKESGCGRAQTDLFVKYVAGYPVSQFLKYAEL